MSPQDLWKRQTPEQKPTRGYEEQLVLNLNKPADATPEEFEKWQEEELSPWAEKQLPIVAIMAVVQVMMLGLMFAVMGINQIVFSS